MSELRYHPEVAARAASELCEAMRELRDEEYANALLADPRMTSTKGILASCGFSYGEIKFVRNVVSGNIPTLRAQKKAQAYLGRVDEEQKRYG